MRLRIRLLGREVLAVEYQRVAQQPEQTEQTEQPPRIGAGASLPTSERRWSQQHDAIGFRT